MKKVSYIISLLMCVLIPLNILYLENRSVNALSTENINPTETTGYYEPEGILSFSNLPEKKEYSIGEELNLTDLKVDLIYYYGKNSQKYIYNNVNPYDYPNVFIINTSEYNKNKIGNYTIKISCSQKIASEYWIYPDKNIISFDVAVKNNNNFELSKNEETKTATITKYTGDAEELTIPYEIDGYSIMEINGDAFSDDKNLKTISIPYSVTSLSGQLSDNAMFTNCNNLEEVNIDEENQTYSSVNGIIYSKDGTDLVYVPVNNKTENYEIPDTVTGIYRYACIGNKNIKSIKMPKSLVNIGVHAFSNCSALEYIIIPNTVEQIQYSAFNYCNNLKDIYYSGNEDEWNSYGYSQFSSDPKIHYNSNGLELTVTSTTTTATSTTLTTIKPMTTMTESDIKNTTTITTTMTTLSTARSNTTSTISTTTTTKSEITNTTASIDPQPKHTLTQIYGIKIDLQASDPNNDNKVDSSDATCVLIDYANRLAETENYTYYTNEQADSNGDGKVDSMDATNILIYYANDILD